MLQTTSSAEGLRLLSQGDIANARDIFKNLVANKVDLAQANYGLGVIALTERDPSLAREHFESCLWHDAIHANALFQLGSIEKRSGNNESAIRYWQRCLEADPDHVSALKELEATGFRGPTQAPPPLPAAHPPTSSEPPLESVDGYDFYGLLRRCDSGVEREMVRLLDEVQEMMVAKRQGVRAFIGSFFALWVFGAAVVLGLWIQPADQPKIIALFILGLLVLMTFVRILQIKCNKIDCERYVFLQQKGVLSTRSKNDHLWLMAHDEVFVNRTLLNRITNDGTLLLGERQFKGFFSGKQLATIQKNFAQLKLLMPVNREVLAAIGELKNMRTGDK